MSSPTDEPVADVGLLSPAVAGTEGERLTGDRAVVGAIVRFESALLRALVRTGVAPAELAPVADALDDIVVDPRRIALEAPRAGNPTLPVVTALRATVPPEHADWIHFGATSQDAVDTALMLVTQDVLRRIEADLGRLAATLTGVVRTGRGVPAVARTLTQHAMPTTLGMRAAGWLAGVLDAVDAVRALPPLPVSLGGPVGTTAGYGSHGPQVVAELAAEVDLAPPLLPWHTRRGPVLGAVSALVATGAATGTFAADVLVLARSEVGEVREAEGGPSSAMRHKANPIQSVLVATAAREMPPLAAVVQASAVAESERPAGAWHAEWQPLRWLLRYAAAAAERSAALAAGLRFDHAAMRRNLDRLLAEIGADDAWLRAQIAPAEPWIDRVLASYEERWP